MWYYPSMYTGLLDDKSNHSNCHSLFYNRGQNDANEVSANVHDHGTDETKLLELKRGSLGKEVGTLEYPDLPWKRKWYPSPSAIEHRKLQTTQKAGSDSRKDVQKDTVAATSPSFQRMITAALGCGQIGYKLPSCQELKGWILKEEVKEMQQYVKDVGVENVVQIITYSISDCMAAAGQRLMEKFRTVFWTVSASYCIELMLEKIGMMDPIRGILDKAKAITKFIHSHATVLKLMRNYTSANTLVKPSKIKLAKPS
ncbi:uncharacterized protein LOC117904748 [Vitis riparia]|uniref:uncharacterized protein LOC117904748 n=1 Tax=Vitis riparia TaxID=96939 RepID=UPI00155AED86|nr:uncharacterized protein LOC117904748 [Vitis riparia]